jgi:hypothetical protein
MKNNPELVDYVPARKVTTASGRIVKSFGVIALLLLAMGIYRGSLPDNPTMGDSASMALGWYCLATIFGVIALLVGYVSWVRSGRIW